jgi:hypothetical protein
VAVGAYVAQDLRDRDGVTRPLLRRAALRLVTSRHAAVHRLGDTYLRSDPPTPEELAVRQQAAKPLLLPPAQPEKAPDAPKSQSAPDAPVGAV